MCTRTSGDLVNMQIDSDARVRAQAFLKFPADADAAILRTLWGAKVKMLKHLGDLNT